MAIDRDDYPRLINYPSFDDVRAANTTGTDASILRTPKDMTPEEFKIEFPKLTKQFNDLIELYATLETQEEKDFFKDEFIKHCSK